MAKLHLTYGGAEYDRTRPLADGRVMPDGIDLTVVFLRYEDMFWRMLQNAEFDLSETSLSAYLISKSQGPDLVAIPAFPSRVFRHSNIFVNRNAGINKPADLKGKRVGVPEFHMTAVVWARGILIHEYGVPQEDVQWLTGGMDKTGAIDKVPLINRPANVSITPISAEKTLNGMLLSGEIDAMIAPRVPSAFRQKHPDIVRLFKDYMSEETAYYRKTKIFPPMHVVAIRREVYERNRWIAQSLYQAFVRALDHCNYEAMWDGHLRYSLPFLPAFIEQTEEVFENKNPFAYGIEENRHTMEALIAHSYEQGLIPKLLEVDELFAPEILRTCPN